jgi:hypothetical protein
MIGLNFRLSYNQLHKNSLKVQLGYEKNKFN